MTIRSSLSRPSSSSSLWPPRPLSSRSVVLLCAASTALLGSYIYGRALRAVTLAHDGGGGDGYDSAGWGAASSRRRGGGRSGGGGGRNPRSRRRDYGAYQVMTDDDETEDSGGGAARRKSDTDDEDAEINPTTTEGDAEGTTEVGTLHDIFPMGHGGGGEEGDGGTVESSRAVGEGEPAPPPPPTPAYWLESDPDDAFERTYVTPEERIRYKHLRDLGKGGSANKGAGIKHFFNPMCRHYRFDEGAMPAVSVVMTSQNEPDDWISLSVESILARTPPDLLLEIIVVDDNGRPGHEGLPENIRRGVDESEWEYISSLSPKVRVIHHDGREGCGRSRLTGARAATGEVLVFVDSHIEMMSGTWYQHLVLPIMENPRTVSMQTIDVIDDLGTRDYSSGVGPLQYGIVNSEFWFGYQADRFGDYMEPINATRFTDEELAERKKWKYQVEVPHKREPYETPFGPGSLFAIRRDEFWRLGGYDEGLYVWGGENTEMAFKVWMCGGRMVMVPCSRVGHMYRQHKKEKDGRTGALSRWPPTLPTEMTDRLGCAYRNGTYTGRFIVLRHPADNFTRITTRNNLRVMEAWVGDHPAKYAYYKRMFGQETLKPEFQRFVDEWKVDPLAWKQMRIKRENKCHDFAWWDKYVFMRLTGRHHPWHDDNKKYMKVSCGNHKAASCELCPQGNGKDWCNGECSWCDSTQKCVPIDDRAKVCRGGAPVTKGGLRKSLKSREAQARGVAGANDSLHLKVRERARLSEKVDNAAAELTISIILPCGFEHDYFIRTAESIFYETPAEILKEIVIVDDASEPPLINSWPEEEAAKFGVKYVRLDTPHGLIGAKQAGAEAATGDVIIFFDCHVKPAEDYWVPYIKEVGENYKRVVIPTITNLNVDTWEEYNRPAKSGGGMSKCYLTFDAEFKWTNDDTPYVPIMSGGLLAISRKWFFEIGGYDSSMKGWGGENLDQSLRIWTCGGEIVSAPESYVAHMWRDGTEKTKAKYKLGSGDAIKNRARAVKAHLGPWYKKTLTFPSFQQWKGKELDTSSITGAFANLKCNNFEWYLNRFRHIYRNAGVAPSEVFQIEAAVESSQSSPLCLQLKTMSWTNYGTADEIVLHECVDGHEQPRPIWWHKSSRLKDGSCCGSLRAWNTDQCVDGRNPKMGEKKLSSYTCDLDSGIEAFLEPTSDADEEDTAEYLLKIGRNENGKQSLCVSMKSDSSLIVGDCRISTKWRKRSPFTPLEYNLLSEESRNSWESEE